MSYKSDMEFWEDNLIAWSWLSQLSQGLFEIIGYSIYALKNNIYLCKS